MKEKAYNKVKFNLIQTQLNNFKAEKNYNTYKLLETKNNIFNSHNYIIKHKIYKINHYFLAMIK